MQIRLAHPGDISALQALYYDTITNICARDYDDAQIEAWSSTSSNTASLSARITGQYFLVAYREDSPSIITGFASMEEDYGNSDALKNSGDRHGYLDLMYIHKDYQRQGIASLLLGALLEKAGEWNFKEMEVHASITARPFFEKHQFVVREEQAVLVRGIALVNFRMSLSLLNDPDAAG